MLTLYRRHLASCEHKAKGRQFKKCKCPIWIQGTVAGEVLRKSLDVNSWERAEKLKLEIANGTQPKKEGITIKDALAAFVRDCEARNLNQSTLRKYRFLRDSLAAFAEANGKHSLGGLDSEDLRKFRQGRGLSPRTASKELERIRAFFNFCVSNDWLPKNPARSIKAPELRPTPTLPFSKIEVMNILGAAKPREATFYKVLLHSGLRIIDAAQLKPEKIVNGKLFLYQQKTGVPVFVPLPPDLLIDLSKLTLTGGFYFVVESENPVSIAEYYRRELRRLTRKMGIKNANPHRFRDTFAVRLLENRVPLEKVSILLGHTDIKTTQRSYAPWVQSLQDDLEMEVSKTWETPKLKLVK